MRISALGNTDGALHKETMREHGVLGAMKKLRDAMISTGDGEV